MQYLTRTQVMLIHSMVLDEIGGAHGIRDRNALEALEALPQQHVFGKELYPTVFRKAAVYIRNIALGHMFIDGNKRTAMVSGALFLELNGYALRVQKGGVKRFALRVVAKKMTVEKIAEWLERHSVKIRRGKNRAR